MNKLLLYQPCFNSPHSQEIKAEGRKRLRRLIQGAKAPFEVKGVYFSLNKEDTIMALTIPNSLKVKQGETIKIKADDWNAMHA